MTPEIRRPSLLRSLVFWGGLLVMGFVVWAWCDSATRWSYLYCGPFVPSSRDSGIAIYHHEGLWNDFGGSIDTSFYKDYGSRTGRPRFARPGYARGGAGELAVRGAGPVADLPESALDPLVAEFSYGRSSQESLLFIPYWCVMLAVLVPWLGLIYWRYRRFRRHRAAAGGAI